MNGHTDEWLSTFAVRSWHEVLCLVAFIDRSQLTKTTDVTAFLETAVEALSFITSSATQ